LIETVECCFSLHTNKPEVQSNSHTSLEQRVFEAITNVKDFPQPGIDYKDISTLFMEPKLCEDMLQTLKEHYAHAGIEGIIALESRGFLFGFPLAMALGVPFIMARKKGKLPRETYGVSYDLEYGSATIEIHKDSIKPGQKILIHDDVLATGGTAHAAAELVNLAGGKVMGFSFLVELSFLEGRKKLIDHSAGVYTLAAY
jgi:adenine phosphoribosyltransferase